MVDFSRLKTTENINRCLMSTRADTCALCSLFHSRSFQEAHSNRSLFSIKNISRLSKLFSLFFSWNGLLRVLLIHFFCTMSFFSVHTAFRNNGTAASTPITKTTKTVTFAATLSTSREIPHRLDHSKKQHLRLWTSTTVTKKNLARNLQEWNSEFENKDWRQVVEEECFLKHPISGKKFHPFWRHVLEDATGMEFEDPCPVPNYLKD